MAIHLEFSPILLDGNCPECIVGTDSEDVCANQRQPAIADTNGNEQDPYNLHVHYKPEVAHLLTLVTVRVAKLPPGQSMSAAPQSEPSKHHSLHGPLQCALFWQSY